jgi:hypothetical protein
MPSVTIQRTSTLTVNPRKQSCSEDSAYDRIGSSAEPEQNVREETRAYRCMRPSLSPRVKCTRSRPSAFLVMDRAKSFESPNM